MRVPCPTDALDRLAAGALPDVEAARVHAHLSTCATCRLERRWRLFEHRALTVRAAMAAPEPEALDALWAGVAARLGAPAPQHAAAAHVAPPLAPEAAPSVWGVPNAEAPRARGRERTAEAASPRWATRTDAPPARTDTGRPPAPLLGLTAVAALMVAVLALSASPTTAEASTGPLWSEAPESCRSLPDDAGRQEARLGACMSTSVAPASLASR